VGGSTAVAVGATVVAGSLVALQAPINSKLGKAVGTFTAASVSFAIGLAVLVTITLVFGEGFGKIGEAFHIPWYYLLGGVLGAVYVTTVLLSVREIGAGSVAAATIAGQLTMSVVIDRLGILGLPQRALTFPRVLGIALLAAGVLLIVRD
jgi:bacterial/archaeal transporter family-2 protein